MGNTRRLLTWYLRSPKDMDVEDDVDVGYYLRGSADPVSITMRARTAPTGRPFVVDVKADGVSLLDSRTLGTLPPGLTSHRSKNVATMKAPAGAWVTLSLVQVGNQEQGRGVTVERSERVVLYLRRFEQKREAIDGARA